MSANSKGKNSLNADSLAALRELIATARILRDTLQNAVQLRVVLDSNTIISDLIWLNKKRVNPEARTSIQELIASQTLIPFAPNIAILEVEKYIPSIAQKNKIPEQQLRATWTNYQKSLTFCEVEVKVRESNNDVRDPKDLPFIKLADQIGASGIATKDKDIAAMGGNTIHFDCIIQLREYSRAKNLELTFRVGGIVLVAVGVGAIAGIIKAIQALIQSITKLPPWVQIALVLGIVFVIVNPKSREAVGSYFKSLGAKIQNGVLNLRDPILDAADKATKAQQRANAALEKVKESLPSPKRIPLSTHIYALCLASRAPLSIAEIEKKVFAVGYKTNSKKFRSYILKILRTDSRFDRVTDGRWVASRKN